jgi:hypothetical protein
MRYGADILFKTCLGLEVEWVEDSDINNDDKHFYYISSPTKSLKCPIHSLSFNDDIAARSAGVVWND